VVRAFFGDFDGGEHRNEQENLLYGINHRHNYDVFSKFGTYMKLVVATATLYSSRQVLGAGYMGILYTYIDLRQTEL
jgi:hypothetical protein